MFSVGRAFIYLIFIHFLTLKRLGEKHSSEENFAGDPQDIYLQVLGTFWIAD